MGVQTAREAEAGSDSVHDAQVGIMVNFRASDVRHRPLEQTVSFRRLRHRSRVASLPSSESWEAVQKYAECLHSRLEKNGPVASLIRLA